MPKAPREQVAFPNDRSEATHVPETLGGGHGPPPNVDAAALATFYLALIGLTLRANSLALPFHLHFVFPQDFSELLQIAGFNNGVHNFATVHARIFDSEHVP